MIVESPTKARTITKFLPKGFTVKASVGHVRDLPTSAKDIPAKYKKLKWSRLGVNVEDGFEPLYVIPKDKRALVREIKAAVKKCDRIYFATDEDREGESISWHLLQLLGGEVPHERLVFHEITRTAIGRSLETPRPIDQDLVRAQETRRIVDRLFGYEVSPLLWKKMLPKLSAGRVQSVAVRLLVERERARQRFNESIYWVVKAQFLKDGRAFDADLVEVDRRRIAMRKDFDPDTGKLRDRSSVAKRPVMHLAEAGAKGLEEQMRSGAMSAKVASVRERPYSTAPQPPYVTSTLQQEANSKLRFQARYTMSLAQQLYENGFITYMRTDSTVLSDEAKTAARRLIAERFGQRYLSETVRHYRNKVKNAQEAHEAIRPAGSEFRAVGEVRVKLGTEAGRLYEMILRRTLASQMKNAVGTNSAVLVDVGLSERMEARFRAAGRTIEFAGYLRAYQAETHLPKPPGDSKQRILPKLAVGDVVGIVSATAAEKRTRPPQRYTEGTLIRRLERLGIGRPSTWASIVDIVQSRSYAFRRSGKLVPTFTAMAVVGLLEEHFTHLMNYEFTAQLEDQLDAIARGELDRKDYLKGFYYGHRDNELRTFQAPADRIPSDETRRGLHALIEEGLENIDPRKVCGISIGKTASGKEVEVRVGRYGPFVSDGTHRCSVPEDLAPDELDLDKACELLEIASKGPEPLGYAPGTETPIYLRRGRYGPFVQKGESKDKAELKRASLLRGMTPESVDLDTALRLLSLPRSLGQDPRTREEVVVANGRFGPFVKSGKEIRSVPASVSPFEISLEQALDLLAKEKPKRRRAARAEPIKVLGNHPVSEKEVKVLSGRWGPYVTDGKINASLPKSSRPEDVSMEQAIDLLQARAARIAAGGGPKRRARAKKA